MSAGGMSLKKYIDRPSSLYICYTLGFIVMFLFVFGYVIFTGRTTVVGHDGITQYYSGFVASSRIYRDFWTSLFSGKGLSLKLWDFGIGFGDDTVTTLNMYGFADPFGMISVFFPEPALGYVFTFVYVIKSYLSGLGFLLFARYHKAGRLGSLTGAYIYVFSVFPVLFGSSECNFMVPVLCLPFMLLGTDLILDKGRPQLLIISTALIATMNFYFLYMAVVAAVLYTLFRYFTETRPVTAAGVLRTFIRFFLSYFEAFLLSAVILFPVILQLMTSGRYGEAKEVPIIYDGAYYFKFISSFLGYMSAGSWTVMGYTAVAFLSVVLMFAVKGKYKKSKVLFIIITVAMLIPVFGFAMTGFAYTNNRWVFVYEFAVAYIVSKLFYEFEAIKGRTIAVLMAATVLYLIYASVLPTERRANLYITALSLCITLTGIILIKALSSKDPAGQADAKTRTRVRGWLVLCAVAGLSLNAFFQFMGYPGHDGALEDMYLPADLDDFRTGYGLDALTAEDAGLYRVDESNCKETRNTGQLRNTMTTGMYFSLITPYHSDFYLKNGILCNHTWNTNGMDHRSILDAVSGVKYYCIPEGRENKVPFNFHDTGKSVEVGDSTVRLYENESPLPMGFAYTSYIPVEKYEALPVEQRQEAMLFGAVTDAKNVPEKEFKPLSKSVLKEIDWGEDVEGDISALKVKKDETVARLRIEPVEDSELYVILTDMDFHYNKRRSQFRDEEWENMSRGERAGIIVDDITSEKIITSRIYAKADDDHSNGFRFGNRQYQYYCGQREFVMNLGTFTSDTDSDIELKFEKAGDYHFDRIDVAALPVQSVRERIAELGDEVMSDLTFDRNRISGRIKLASPSVVYIAVPLSKGWKAYVDGVRTDLESVNTFYMGVEADAGEHDIELYYETPGLKAGAVMTLLGVIILISSFFVTGRKRAGSAD